MAKKTYQFYIDVTNYNLESLLKELEDKNIPKSEYKNLQFKLNWSGCYYEGDWPEIELTGNLKKRNLIYQIGDSHLLSYIPKLEKEVHFFILGEKIKNDLIYFTDSNEEEWKGLIPKEFKCSGDSFEFLEDKEKAIDILKKNGYTEFVE